MDRPENDGDVVDIHELSRVIIGLAEETSRRLSRDPTVDAAPLPASD